MKPQDSLHRPMKALSMQQPFASLFLTPEKRWETRSRRIHFRGLLAIQASKGFPLPYQALCSQEAFRTALLESVGVGDEKQLPRGAIIGVVEITGCIEAERLWSAAAAVLPRGPQEKAFGNFARGRFAWQRAGGTFRLKEPVPCDGSLGLWDVPPKVEKQMREQLNLGAWPFRL